MTEMPPNHSETVYFVPPSAVPPPGARPLSSTLQLLRAEIAQQAEVIKDLKAVNAKLQEELDALKKETGK
jgi:hypothetical protein